MSTRVSITYYIFMLAGAFLFSVVSFAALASAEEVRGSVNVRASAQSPSSVREQLKERMENIRDAKLDMQEKRNLASSSASTTLRARIEAKLDERREIVAQKLEAVRVKVLSKFAVDALNQFKKVDDRLTDALSRLADISSRIDSRIAKLKSENIDMAKAESLNAAAKQKLSDAQAKVSAIVVPTLPSNASTTKAEINASLRTAREQVKAAEIAIQAARDALKDVVAEMRRAGGSRADADADVNATTSASVSN